MRRAMMFLQNYSISINLAVKIYQEYGPAMYTILQNNPYKLADDYSGVGFKMAGLDRGEDRNRGRFSFRIKTASCIHHRATANGHTYLPEDELADRAAKASTQVEISEIDKHLMDMQMDKRLVIRERKKAENRNGCFVQAESAVSGRMRPQQIFLVNRNASNVSNIKRPGMRRLCITLLLYRAKHRPHAARLKHHWFRIGRTDSEKSGSHPEKGTDRAG